MCATVVFKFRGIERYESALIITPFPDSYLAYSLPKSYVTSLPIMPSAGVLSKPDHDYQMFVSTNNHSKELGWPDLQVVFPPVLWNTRVLRSLGFLEEVSFTSQFQK